MIAREFVGVSVCALVVACGSGGSDVTDPTSPPFGPEAETDTSPSDAGEGPSGVPGGPGQPPADEPGDAFEPPPEFEQLDGAASEALRTRLDSVLAGLGSASMGALVVDLETEQELYARNADTWLVPASNTKMFTTAAVAEILGPDTRIETEVWGASPSSDGTVVGGLHLIGFHDFSWSTTFHGSSRAPLDRIAAQLRKQGVQAVEGGLTAHGEFLVEGQTLGTYNSSAQRSSAVAAFRAALSAAGVTVSGSDSTQPQFEPPSGTEKLVTWSSPPLSSLAVPINVFSHNEFADIMLRHLGYEVGSESSYLEGGKQIVDWMASMPTLNDGAVWNDGSGLSHGNRATARNMVDLLRFMERTDGADRWMRTMAVSGTRGTLRNRMTDGATAGFFWGKTGTLPSIGVVTLSGILFHPVDGRRYALSLLFNGASVNAGRLVQNDVVAVLAENHHQIDSRPDAPTLQMARTTESNVIELGWSEVAGADGYVVWVSEDAESWSLEDARRVDGTTHRLGGLSTSGDVFVRVTAFVEDAGAVHSKPSDVYGSTAAAGKAAVLLVDGNDRWQDGPVGENPRGVGHRFAAQYGEAIDEAFDTVSNETVAEEIVSLSEYEVVLWMLGEESLEGRCFDDLEQSVLRAYVESGGSVMVSGAELAWSMGAEGSPEDIAFLADVLHVGFGEDDANTWWMDDGSGLFEDAPVLGFNTRSGIVVDFPDQLEPVSGGREVLSYAGGAGGAAAVFAQDQGTTLVFGVPFESIESAAARTWVMDQVLDALRK